VPGTGDIDHGDHRGALAVATGRLYDFLKSHRMFDAVAVWISRRVRESPPTSRLNVVLGPLRARFRGEMTAADVLKVVDALEAQHLRFWIAGGWGVDLLAGAPRRRHDDLDVVLSDFEADQARACETLAPLGYRLIEVLDGLWMTPRNLIDDGVGHQIEILGIDRARLHTALGLSVADPAEPVEVSAPQLFTVGTLQGRPVPCLSAELQLLFHSGFDLRGVDEGDMALLRSRAVAGEQGSTPR
jgi:lincosamide nucleotidyltransferase A/C/D/E